MARLLTLALGETTANEANGYRIVAWNHDEKHWVTLHVSMDRFSENGQPIWDIFAFTDVNIRQVNAGPAEEYALAGGPTRLIQRVETWEERKKWLDYLTDDMGVRGIHDAGRYVGLVRPTYLSPFSLKPDHARLHRGISRERTIAWRANIPFNDGYEEWDGLCKDMRWKQYWLDVAINRPHQRAELEQKWLDYTLTHPVYFLVRMWDWPRHTGPFGDERYWAISGVHCLPVEIERPVFDDDVPF